MPKAALLLATILLTAWSAMAQEAFVMRGGQWTSTITGAGPRPRTTSYCMADAPLDAMAAGQQPPQECTKKEITRIRNGVKMDFVCEGMAMHGTAVSIGEDAVRTEMTMDLGGQSVQMVTESKRTGPCKPGEKPVNVP